MTPKITQVPEPGRCLLQFQGDMIVFRLSVDPTIRGNAFIRTNLGRGHISRQEVIRHVEFNVPRLSCDWYDIPMTATASGQYEVRLGLAQVGHFEAKCLFLSQDQTEPFWPAGPNTIINVEPADTCCANIIYNAFVRQFGPFKTKRRAEGEPGALPLKALDAAGYTVIPPSGTFRDLIAELDFIMDRLGCRILQLLPIHPTPTTYGRMGRFGSPYAALSFTAVDPALAVFDPKATPLDQFLELVDAVHARHGNIIIDMAINHTGWAASLHESHPQWLVRRQNGEIENPEAWGVVWEDLARLDYQHKALWIYMAQIFLTWCQRGVDGFRCDAGYMIPIAAWQYIIAKVRTQFPDTLFLLEGLGGKIEVTRTLLNQANFNWAYSELFQNYDRSQIEHYLPGANEMSAEAGLTVHFAETHDNNRLAATSKNYARMRTALCALLAPNGAFAFANGVEWFADEKINVHEGCGLNWGANENQVMNIARLNRLLKTHPCFGPSVDLTLVAHGPGNFIALARQHRLSSQRLIILVNLNTDQPVSAAWNSAAAELGNPELLDLLSNTRIQVHMDHSICRIDLNPAQVLCLADVKDDRAGIKDTTGNGEPPIVTRQRLQAKVLEVLGAGTLNFELDMAQAAAELQASPEAFCRGLNPSNPEPGVICWTYPQDLRRQVMVPPHHLVLLRADHPFRVRIIHQERVLAIDKSLNDDHGHPFILLPSLNTPPDHQLLTLEMTVFHPTGVQHHEAQLLYLSQGERVRVRTCFSRKDNFNIPMTALGTNGRGAMMRVHADWQNLVSRYDALLAANLNPDYPQDRQVVLTRCRAWVVFEGYSQALNPDCLDCFGFDYTRGAWWRYQVPVGQGQHIILEITTGLDRNTANTLHLHVQRMNSSGHGAQLADSQPITVIIRPDIEDRNFHHTTKAYTGPEQHWPASVTMVDKGFCFAPADDHTLTIQVDRGQFVAQPEWYYMVHRPLEAERGLDPDSDLFGPGYFTTHLSGGQDMMLTATVTCNQNENIASKTDTLAAVPWQLDRKDVSLEKALTLAMDQFVVQRGAYHTVIAGFPWFLDWGRDTLIAARGLIAAGRLKTVKAILVQFACFEDQGTLPNMIRGQDAANRNTSDAPLWFFTACADLLNAEADDAFLEIDCNGRSLRRVLIDMAQALINGTPNGICMDADSGLIFSPSHFTWMDTNHPAATPRQGYPIEIQALWFAALNLLACIDKHYFNDWAGMAAKVQTNLSELFWQRDLGYMADCRHAATGQSAFQAKPDDALRPNQLLAVTLGAIEDQVLIENILHACETLLVPGAIRSLADRPVKTPLEVRHHDRLLNDPRLPYHGCYIGDEDTRRKPAYHNGTAWTWLFPSFCEAWAKCYGSAARPTALAWLSSSIQWINRGCVGQVPEILDGDTPHTPRGCDAQAWGVSELLRVWKDLID